MAQNLVQVKNPWGAQVAAGAKPLEAQRSDFFTVDFGGPLASFNSILERAAFASILDGSQTRAAIARQLQRSLPVANEAIYLSKSVELPDRRMQVNQTKQHEMNIPFPGADEIAGQVTITLNMDVPNADAVYSQVNALMRTWTAIVRAGRAGQNQNELQLGLRSASLNGSGWIPAFRQDIIVSLWRGMSFSGGVPNTFFGVDSPPTSTESSLVNCGGYLLSKAWLAGFQPGALAHAQSGIMDAKATFYCDAVIELSPQ